MSMVGETSGPVENFLPESRGPLDNSTSIEILNA